ncbi:hypothetical protein [Nonomuraea sp. NPDC049784]|uniref:hypothetical protein n=1 Tax=Nonomuraea sp. NPDC049784 TaxID=3154361 RepID=UPI0033F8FAE1
MLDPVRQSHFASVDPDRPLWPDQPLDHMHPNINAASVDDLITALADDSVTRSRRDRHRWAFLVMTRVDRGPHKVPDISGAGVFLTREDAEDAVAQIRPYVVDGVSGCERSRAVKPSAQRTQKRALTSGNAVAGPSR